VGKGNVEHPSARSGCTASPVIHRHTHFTDSTRFRSAELLRHLDNHEAAHQLA
jgi:hypothetical protein